MGFLEMANRNSIIKRRELFFAKEGIIQKVQMKKCKVALSTSWIYDSLTAHAGMRNIIS